MVEQAGDKSSGKGTERVDGVIRPMGCRERGPERPRGVQSPTRERTGDEDAKRNRQANAETGDGAKRASFINGGGEDGKHEEERRYALKSHTPPARKIPRPVPRTQSHSAPSPFGHDRPQPKCGRP